MIEQALAYILKNDTALQAINGTRVYPNTAPQNVNPNGTHIVYNTITAPRVKTLAGQSNLAHPLIQLDVYGRKYADVKAACDRIRAIFSAGYNAVVLGKQIRWVWYEDESDGFSRPIATAEKGLNRATVQLTIWHEE